MHPVLFFLSAIDFDLFLATLQWSTNRQKSLKSLPCTPIVYRLVDVTVLFRHQGYVCLQLPDQHSCTCPLASATCVGISLVQEEKQQQIEVRNYSWAQQRCSTRLLCIEHGDDTPQQAGTVLPALKTHHLWTEYPPGRSLVSDWPGCWSGLGNKTELGAT